MIVQIKLEMKELLVAIDLHSMETILWKSMATVNFLVINILQDTFFCVQQKKGTSEGWEMTTGFSFLGDKSL